MLYPPHTIHWQGTVLAETFLPHLIRVHILYDTCSPQLATFLYQDGVGEFMDSSRLTPLISATVSKGCSMVLADSG